MSPVEKNGVNQLIPYKVNFDYERSAEGALRQVPRRLQAAYEWIYFYANEEQRPLASQIDYPGIYLNKVQELGFQKTQVLQHFDQSEDWWGRAHELKLNSKAYFCELREKFKLAHLASKAKVIRSNTELARFHFEFPLMLKSDFSFSGNGNVGPIINRDELISFTKKKGFPWIIEPFLKVQRNLGLFFIKGQTKPQVYETLIDFKFQFKGIKSIEYVDEDLINSFEAFAVYFFAENQVDYFSIDVIEYQDDEGRNQYFPNELNCRKTMGYVYLKMQQKFNDFKYSNWIILERAKLKSLEYSDLEREVHNFNQGLGSDGKIIHLCPLLGHFVHFLILSKEFQNLEQLHLRFLQMIRP